MAIQTEQQTAERMKMPMNYHYNAAALIIAAAEKSGLLRDVAQALRCADTGDGRPDGYLACADNCLACAVLEQLVDRFGDECRHPRAHHYGEDFELPKYSDAELAPYLRK